MHAMSLKIEFIVVPDMIEGNDIYQELPWPWKVLFLAKVAPKVTSFSNKMIKKGLFQNFDGTSFF